MTKNRWEAADDHELLEAVDDHGRGLTRWEIDFVEDAWKRLENPELGSLTEGQRSKLEQIANARLPEDFSPRP